VAPWYDQAALGCPLLRGKRLDTEVFHTRRYSNAGRHHLTRHDLLLLPGWRKCHREAERWRRYLIRNVLQVIDVKLELANARQADAEPRDWLSDNFDVFH
jgi:hypothetical protein